MTFEHLDYPTKHLIKFPVKVVAGTETISVITSKTIKQRHNKFIFEIPPKIHQIPPDANLRHFQLKTNRRFTEINKSRKSNYKLKTGV